MQVDVQLASAVRRCRARDDRISGEGEALRATPPSVALLKRGLRGRCGFGVDSVTDTWRGVDDLGFSKFASESPDRDFDRVGEGVGVFIPRLREEVLCAEGAGSASEEGFEHGELLRR